jgi:tRNA 2-thiouridine synthesizing protein D
MTKSLALVVTTPPHSHLTASAINVALACINNGITLLGVFFYQDGVLNSAKHLSIPADEYQSLAKWQALNSEYNVPLYICISAAEKRGLSDEATNNEDDIASNIDRHFTVSGLGELVELTSNADRVLQL